MYSPKILSLPMIITLAKLVNHNHREMYSIIKSSRYSKFMRTRLWQCWPKWRICDLYFKIKLKTSLVLFRGEHFAKWKLCKVGWIAKIAKCMLLKCSLVCITISLDSFKRFVGITTEQLLRSAATWRSVLTQTLTYVRVVQKCDSVNSPWLHVHL